MTKTNPLSRRSLMQAALGVVLPGGGHGRIKPPVPAPLISVTTQSGDHRTLPDLLTGYGTALQLMFTSCETTCPMQGAIFGRVQNLVPDIATRKLQLFSLSIDPASDTPKALKDWLQRFHARTNWVAATPARKDLELVKEFFGQEKTPTDDHSTQVHIFNRQGMLIYRTIELPSAEEISGILEKL